MTTTIGTEKEVHKMLSHLIQLDFDAAEAYQTAIDRLEDPQSREQLGKFRQDHIRHTEELSRFLAEANQPVPSKGDFKRFLTRGKVVIGDLRGDKGILQAMKSNEDDTNQAYERAVEHPDCSAPMREVLRKNLEDERRHRDWIERRLSSMQPPAPGEEVRPTR